MIQWWNITSYLHIRNWNSYYDELGRTYIRTHSIFPLLSKAKQIKTDYKNANAIHLYYPELYVSMLISIKRRGKRWERESTYLTQPEQGLSQLWSTATYFLTPHRTVEIMIVRLSEASSSVPAKNDRQLPSSPHFLASIDSIRNCMKIYENVAS